MRFTALWVVLCLFTGTSLLAQTANKGSITGTVKDQSGAVIAGVQVTIRETGAATGRAVSTDSAGVYRAPLLEPGVYTLRFTRDGFHPMEVLDAKVLITETAVVDVTMKVGAAAQVVTVSADILALQTTDATTGRVIEEKTIRELPLASRNFTQLLTLSSGAFAPIPDNAAIGLNSQDISVNGSRPTNNNLILNAVDANQIGLNNAANLPIPATDTLQEFKVQTSLYDASTGRSGGAAIAAVTKSGTSQYHGDLYEFFRNDALNANNFFFNATGTPRPVLKRNQFGATFGGPLSLPGGYDGRAHSTFFFVSYQGSRETNGASLISSVASLSLPVGLTDTNRTPAGLSQAFGVPQNQISQVAVNLLNARLPNGNLVIPSPQVQKAGTNFTESVPAHFLENQFNTNLDHNFGSNDKFAAKFFSINYPTKQEFLGFFDAADAPNLPGFGGNLDQRNRVLSLVETHVFNGNLVNEARAGFTRVYANFREAEPISLASVGITRFNQSLFPGIPSIQVLGSFRIGPLPIFDVRTGINNYQFSDTLSYVRGRHSLKFGEEFKREQENFNVDFFQRGIVLFLGFNDFLQGNPFISVDGSGILNRNFRNFDAAGYVQDDFKVSQKLTLNLGLRYEVDGPPSDTQGRLATFDPALYKAGNPPNGFVLAGNVASPFRIPGVPLTSNTVLKTSDYNNFAPRVGFAYKPFNGHPLVVRGGYGIFYSRISNEAAVFSFTNPPFAELGEEQPAPGSFANPLPQLPLPSQFPIVPIIPGINSTGTALTGLPISAFALDPNIETPYVQQYNLTIQHEFAKDFVVEVGYVGSRGVKLLRRVGIAQSLLASPQNPVNGITTNTMQNADLRSPFPGLSPSGFVQLQTSGSSDYNSLQASVTKHFGHGLQFLASYTFSKSLDDAGSASTLGDSRINSDGDQHNLRLNHGPSDFDRPHRFVVSYTYDLPSLTSNAILRPITSNWEFSGIVTVQSGTPLDILDTAGGALFGGSMPSTGIISRASFAPGASAGTAKGHGSIEGRLNDFFNQAALIPAPGGLFGDLGRNILRGPNERDVDFSVLRRFPVRWVEGSTLEFRAEFFNLFNLVNFANPVTDIAAGVPSPSNPRGTFGVITATSTSPRIVQFALKYNF